jgi:hypothetical protein
LKNLPAGVRLGHNLTAFRGGLRLWHLDDVQTLSEDGKHAHPIIDPTEYRLV